MATFDPHRALELSKSIEPWIIERRRQLHQCPELLYDLHETSKLVCETLNDLNVVFQSGVAETGVVASVGSGSGPCVMLRADMDALPIEELADVEFRSRNSGRMHACGHDCHTAMLLGAARLLKEHEAELQGTVKLCFQPAEEGGAGGKRMCEAGVMTNPDVTKVFGLHMWPMIPTGCLTGRPGPFLASTNSFEVRVRGRGGHAAMPHLCTDAVAAAANIVSAAQTIVSREQDPLDPAVISFTAINTAESYNVIPAEVTVRGTIRSLDSDTKDRLKIRLQEVAQCVAQQHRCESEFATVGEDYPETANDPQLWDSVQALGKQLVGDENVSVCEPVLGGEDFAYYGAHAPSCFVAVGCRNEASGCIHGLHHPEFKVDERALHIGTALHIAFVAAHL